MTGLLERIGVELPIFQAGLGGGISAHELAAAVSEAGGLGTIGTLDPSTLEAELTTAKGLTGKPVAVNLLLPFARRAHWEAARKADVVVTFWGQPQRHLDCPWIHQCGSVEEAQAAVRAGADAVIAQGVEAGGHVRGTTPALELLDRVRAALPTGFPVLVAGGVAQPADVREALDAGAEGVVAGTRFVLSEECRAHPEYKRRLIAADETVLTELFGLGWPQAPHRVVANRATERWLRRGPRGPAPTRLANRALTPVAGRLPLSVVDRLAKLQRPAMPLLSPAAALEGAPDSTVEATPLYAGKTVARIRDLRPAAELARELCAG